MIYIFKNLSIGARDTLKNILKALISSFGILFLISFFVVYLSLRDSIKSHIENSLLGKLDINEIVISPGTAKKSKLLTRASNVQGTIPVSTVRRIRSMTELQNVYTIIKLDYESIVRGEMLGQARRIHMPVLGINRGFFKGKDPRWYRFRSGDPVPVVAPRAFLEILNNYLAIIDAPRLTPATMKGFPLQLIIRTVSGGPEERKEFRINAEIHSFTDIFNFLGVVVPTEYIVKFAREHAEDSGTWKKGYRYVMAYGRVKETRDLPAVTARLRKMGLSVESQNEIAEKANRALDIIDEFSLVVIGIFLLLSGISIFNSYLNIVYNRSQKFSLKRVIGASKLGIILGFVIEAAMVGALYGVIGYYTGIFLLKYLSANIAEWVPALEGVKISASGSNIFIPAILLSAAVSSVSAFVPALFASSLNLFKAVRK